MKFVHLATQRHQTLQILTVQRKYESSNLYYFCYLFFIFCRVLVNKINECSSQDNYSVFNLKRLKYIYKYIYTVHADFIIKILSVNYTCFKKIKKLSYYVILCKFLFKIHKVFWTKFAARLLSYEMCH